MGDLTLAAEGGLRNNTVWLIDEIRRKKKRDASLAVPDWPLLVEEFGEAVARGLRDFCQAYWRFYTPKLRSEVGEDQNSIPWAIVVGVSGIAMEARETPRWASRLNRDEAARAIRYALWELNSPPAWSWQLLQEHTETVTEVLANEIRWELRQPPRQGPSSYVLSRLRWASPELVRDVRPRLVQLLQELREPEFNALTEAITVILRDPAPLPAGFTALVAERVRTASDEDRQTVWLSAQICVEAKTGLRALAHWLENAEPTDGERRVTLVLNNIWGDRFGSFNSQHQSFLTTDHLLHLLKLVHAHVRPPDDIHRVGTYSPTVRDHAQEARWRLLTHLRELPGEKTYAALLELAHLNQGTYFGDRLRVRAEERAEADIEFEPWPAEKVAAFAAELEGNPTSQRDLFEIALSRLDDLKLEIEEGDESEAALLQRVEHENELRRIIANRLRHAARGKYTTASEEELADRTPLTFDCTTPVWISASPSRSRSPTSDSGPRRSCGST